MDQSSRCCCEGSWKPRSPWRSSFRGMIFMIPSVTQVSTHILISVRLERREILGVKVLARSVPDVTADEPMPDTSEIPVPNSSVYAPARNPRVRWRSDALERPTPQVASPIEPSKIVPLTASPETPTTFPPWSSPVSSHLDT